MNKAMVDKDCRKLVTNQELLKNPDIDDIMYSRILF